MATKYIQIDIYSVEYLVGRLITRGTAMEFSNIDITQIIVTLISTTGAIVSAAISARGKRGRQKSERWPPVWLLAIMWTCVVIAMANTGILAWRLLSSNPVVLRSEVITIKTFHGRYVTAMDAGWDWEIRAEAEMLGDWEKFVLLYLDNGKVALKTNHGRYVTATDDTGYNDWELRGGATEIGKCEQFTLINLSNKKLALETCYGRYVTAFNAERHWILRAETQKLSAWEEFTIVPWQ